MFAKSSLLATLLLTVSISAQAQVGVFSDEEIDEVADENTEELESRQDDNVVGILNDAVTAVQEMGADTSENIREFAEWITNHGDKLNEHNEETGVGAAEREINRQWRDDCTNCAR